MITRLALGFSAMTSPLSVLLIIGAAVVGPIEAQPKPDAYQNYVVGCAMRNTEFKQAVPCAEVAMAYAERESLPELCERAMREVGASKWYRYEKSAKNPSGLITAQLRDEDRAPGDPPPEVNWTLPQTAYEKLMHEDHAQHYRGRPGFSPEFSFWSTYWGGPVVRCIPTPQGYRR